MRGVSVHSNAKAPTCISPCHLNSAHPSPYPPPWPHTHNARPLRAVNPHAACPPVSITTRPAPRQGVVAVSLWGLLAGGSMNYLRVFRAFRVLRLFKKLQPMRKILISLGACVKPVLSAFVILFILASIYAQV
jgi:hypothetical protein